MRTAAALALLCAACNPHASARAVEEPRRAEHDRELEALLASLEAEPGELGRDDVPIEDPSGRALASFHEALAQAEAGERAARVVVYGGSHAASDLYTGRMREVLQARFGDAGHGFVPLVPMVHRQWAWGVRIDEAEGFEPLQVSLKRREPYRYGLAGAAFLAEEPGAFAAIESDHWGNGRWASRLELLYDRAPGGGALEVWLDGRRVDTLSTDAPSPQNGLQSYEVSDAPHRLEVRAAGDGPVTVYGVTMERERPGVVLHNLGLVGGKARHHLLWDEAQWAAYFERLAPDLVVLSYGNNEATDAHLGLADHEAHLRAVLARVRREAPRASCLLVGPTDRPEARPDGALEPREVVAELTAMQRQVALDAGCGFFDTLAFQGGLGASADWLAHDPPYLRDDLLHLTRDGYRRWGEALVRALLMDYRPPA
ncbi:MAG: hypothetical protein KF729_25545 [Sandaracinaceae bacterium]|nr:hypothetical protein [Sandaracinaceae bacterium]